MAWVYILECADGSFYTGSTIDLEKRLAEHNEGLGANFTRRRLPARLVFAEDSESVETAFMREKQIQGWSRAKKLALIEGRMEAFLRSRGAPFDRLRERTSRGRCGTSRGR